ncbi:MAG: hypothetical protein KZQ85_17205 [Candidatus Thiodiazotropha sp. (ex Myrtea sp. 'scaly one' KF741663)]|nr:hypothetical protein [Candidatus Thiodiazotropha sp. (ex Myrtea sp. 'scaly one' KF741663)]
MSVSKEQIKEYCKKRYVEPARYRGDSHVAIRSSDVLEAFGLAPDDTIVCEALWSNQFEYENYLFRVSNSCQKQNEVSVMVYQVLALEGDD